MTFEYIPESEHHALQKVSHLGMGLLLKMKLGDSLGDYQPPADELVGDIEEFLIAHSKDPDVDPDDPAVPKIMSTLLGYSFIWACGYRWAKSPLSLAYAPDVVVSPDERYYLDPVALVLEFLDAGTPNLRQLLIDAYNGDFPDTSTPIQIPTED